MKQLIRDIYMAMVRCAFRYGYDDGTEYTLRHKWYDIICYRIFLAIPIWR